MPIQVQETSRTPNRHDQNKISSQYITVKIISTEKKGRILKTVRKKIQITYKGKPIKYSRFLNRKLKSKKGME
jgi:hypothetical protein